MMTESKYFRSRQVGDETKEYFVDITGKKHGHYFLFKKSKLKTECFFFHGELNGSFTTYNDNMNKEVEACYRFGLKVGKYKHYYSNGDLFLEGTYKKGKRVDYWKVFSKKGNLLLDINYNLPIETTFYYLNGELCKKDHLSSIYSWICELKGALEDEEINRLNVLMWGIENQTEELLSYNIPAVKKQWNDLMSHLKENDSRLYTVLAKGKLVTYENNITHMTYVVEYDQIHKLLFKQIQKKKYISRLQKMISEFHKHKFEIKTLLENELELGLLSLEEKLHNGEVQDTVFATDLVDSCRINIAPYDVFYL